MMTADNRPPYGQLQAVSELETYDVARGLKGDQILTDVETSIAEVPKFFPDHPRLNTVILTAP